MIKKVLTYFAACLDDYLRQKFPQPEGVAKVGFIGNSSDEKPCKLIISLINIERETTGGISGGLRRHDSTYERNSPPLLLNLDLMLAAVYDEKRYVESLSVLSETLTFLQSYLSFNLNGQMYTIEILTLSVQDINNIWTTLGGQYYPSVMCRMRRIVIDTGEIVSSGNVAKRPIIE